MQFIKVKNELWISKKNHKLTPKEQKEVLNLMKENDCDTIMIALP